MKKTFIHAKTIILILLLIGCGKSDPFPSVKLPIYPSAINVHQAIDSPAKGAKSVVYDVSMNFPAKELTDFYNKEMGAMGFIPLPEKGIGTFKWEYFNRRSGNWEETTKVPERYTATWVNKEKTQRVWLYIAYEPRRNIKNWENTPMVSCNMAKYFDMEMDKKQLDKMIK
ncbi:MAG: hypothetical protein A2W27_02965 [Deltaproteobacteria bacterium RBG_16_44_11]|nr:MAG: hypothetical protein A2W27_02965 [Deltaproteobacteria bacterium RBG_16_44_11]